MFEKIKASDGNPYTPDAVFTDSDGNRVGVIGQDTTPNLSVSEMQFSVEAVVREVVIPAYNSLVDALNALAAPAIWAQQILMVVPVPYRRSWPSASSPAM